MVNLLAAALDQASHGVPVFPVDPANKHPLTPHGFKDATADVQQIYAWWTWRPDAMIGMPTGPRAWVWVLDIDVDVPKGVDGRPAMARLETTYGSLPPTLTSKTPRGGEHRFFQWVGGIKSSCSKLGPGLDVRGRGGYVVLPPSVRADGTPYRWLGEADHPVAAPQWLIDKARGAPERRPGIDLSQIASETGRAIGDGSARDRAWARSALEKECATVAAALPGTRNAALNLGAFNLFQLVKAGTLSEQETLDRLFQAAEANGSVADDGAAQAWATIKSGAGKAQPRYRSSRQ